MAVELWAVAQFGSVASPPTMIDLGQHVVSSQLCDTKQIAKDPSLSMQVVARDPEYLAFANHLRRFNTRITAHAVTLVRGPCIAGQRNRRAPVHARLANS